MGHGFGERQRRFGRPGRLRACDRGGRLGREEYPMKAVTVEEVERLLRTLTPDKLAVVAEFVAFVSQRPAGGLWAFEGDEEGAALAEAGMGEYKRQLEDYEDQLARGEIQW
jgi:hypothetical protein